MQTKTKIILLVAAGFLLLLIGGISGGLIVRNYYKPTPPDPINPSTIAIIQGMPGTIIFTDELFYRDHFSTKVTSTGAGAVLYTITRPERWQCTQKRHFLGFGVAGSIISGEFLYGGYLSYRYRIGNDISVLTQLHLLMNKELRYDTGLRLGLEFGIQ